LKLCCFNSTDQFEIFIYFFVGPVSCWWLLPVFLVKNHRWTLFPIS